MGKDIPLAGSDDRDDNRFERAEQTSTQTNYYVGNKDTGEHCHMWKDNEGNSGVEHRGECAVCEDEEED